MKPAFLVLVDFPVRHIEIPADENRFPGLEPSQVLPEGVLPLTAVAQPGQLCLGVGGVDSHQVKLRILQSDHSALLVMLLDAQAVLYRQRLLFGKDRGARIALALGTVPVLVIARGIHLRLAGLHLGLLDAEKVCVLLLEKVQKTLLQAGPDAVYIP